MSDLHKIKERISFFFHPERAMNKRMRIFSGLSIGKEGVSFSGTKRLLHATTNALLMFSFTAGTTAALAEAFNVKYHAAFLFFVFGFFSLFFSLMNCRKLWQNIGYISFFILFTFLLISNRQFINSGLNGFLNDLFKYASDKWRMDVEKTYNEAFPEQHMLTVTMFFLMVGLACMLVINFIFNNEKSPLTVFVVIFPFLQMGLYFDEIPGFFSIILICTALICCFCMRHTFQFVLPITKKDVLSRHIKKKHYYIQYSNGRVVIQVFAVILGFILLLSCFANIICPPKAYIPDKKLTAMKEKTEEAVRLFMLYGFSYFWNNGEDTSGPGGMSSGTLGNVGTVRSDFQTDLTVTFAPYAYETVYLKGNIFTTYTGRSWNNFFYEPVEEGSVANDWLLNMEADRLKDLYTKDPMVLSGKMLVEYKDYSLMGLAPLNPYYTIFNNTDYATQHYRLQRKPVALFGDKYASEMTYYVYQNIWDSDLADKPVETDYDKFVHENYLSVYGLIGTVSDNIYLGSSSGMLNSLYEDPDGVADRLKELCQEEGFSGSTREIISQLQEFFKRDYLYTLNPGKTPKDKDFASYFLFESKKGYCSYFATAGTLLLRSMGIPARYVEGYVIPMSDVVDAEILEDEKYEDWLSGNALIGKTAVVTATINDSRAHAWCEVYLNGFGWVPVEFTPPSDDSNEDDLDYSKLWNAITTGDGVQNNFNAIANIMGSKTSAILSFVLRCIAAIVITALIIILFRITRKKLNERKGLVPLYTGLNAKMLRQYQGLCKRLYKKGLADSDNLTAADVFKALKKAETLKLNDSEQNELLKLYRDAAFGNEAVNSEKYKRWSELITKALRSI